MRWVGDEGQTWRSVGSLGKAMVGHEGPPTFYDGVAVGADEWGEKEEEKMYRAFTECCTPAGKEPREPRRSITKHRGMILMQCEAAAAEKVVGACGIAPRRQEDCGCRLWAVVRAHI